MHWIFDRIFSLRECYQRGRPRNWTNSWITYASLLSYKQFSLSLSLSLSPKIFINSFGINSQFIWKTKSKNYFLFLCVFTVSGEKKTRLVSETHLCSDVSVPIPMAVLVVWSHAVWIIRIWESKRMEFFGSQEIKSNIFLMKKIQFNWI